jgi:hypothetical protein
MNITEKQLAEFKLIFREQTGKEISDQEALELTQKLLGLVKLVYKPISKLDEEDSRQMKFNF